MRIIIGTDHAAFPIKSHLVAALTSLGHEVVDFGCHSEAACDHSDISIPLAQKVAAGEFDRGVLACGSGAGMVMGANKVPGIFAFIMLNEEMARLSRRHNNTNIAVFAGRTQSAEEIANIASVWLQEKFDGGRHEKRMQKLLDYEKERDTAQ